MKIKDIILALLVTLAWGIHFVVNKHALFSFSPMLFGALRFSLVFLFTLPFFLKDRPPITIVMLLSFITFINFVALNYAIYISGNLAPVILMSGLVVPFSTLLGIYFLKEKFTIYELCGMLIASLGFTIVIHERSIEDVPMIVILLTTAAAALFACYNLLVKKLAGFNILAVLSQLSLLISMQFFVGSFLQEEWPNFDEIHMSSVAALLYSVLVCSIFSYYIWFYLLAKYPLGKIAQFNLLSPIFGCLVTIIILEEPISLGVIIGGVIVLIGLAFIELKHNVTLKS